MELQLTNNLNRVIACSVTLLLLPYFLWSNIVTVVAMETNRKHKPYTYTEVPVPV